MNLQNFKYVGYGVLIILVGLLAYFAFFRKPAQINKTQNINKPTIQKNAPKTYINSEYGFSFNYPSTWSYTESKTATEGSKLTIMFFQKTETPISIDVYDQNPGTFGADEKNITSVPAKNLNVKRVIIPGDETEGSDLTVVNNGKYYLVLSNWMENQKDFDSLLSSIQFK